MAAEVGLHPLELAALDGLAVHVGESQACELCAAGHIESGQVLRSLQQVADRRIAYLLRVELNYFELTAQLSHKDHDVVPDEVAKP